MSKILVTGGCGYIGSHTIVDLIDNGYDVVSIDNLSNSSEAALDGIERITGRRVVNYNVDLRDLAATHEVFDEEGDIDGVIHFAAYKAVGESVEKPWAYYQNNLLAQINILDCIVKHGIDQFVFSSSCSVYGDTREMPVTEDTPWGEATSPYGRTKQIGEKMSEDVLRNTGCRRIYLRYFNPVGAHPSAMLGEAPDKVLNIVPIMAETAAGIRDSFTVYGDDFPTPDGTCIRDYIHIMDVARAHTLALEHISSGRMETDSDAFNLGIGEGLSVFELIHTFENVTGEKLNYTVGSRRPGDVARIYADPTKAHRVLAWKAKYSVEDMMRTAWEWERRRSRI